MAKVKLTNREILNLQSTLTAIANSSKAYGAKFQYAVIKNSKALKITVEAILETKNKIEKKYNEERVKFCKKYSEKDKAGKYKFIDGALGGNEYLIAKSKKHLFDDEIEKLQGKYKDVLIESNKIAETEDSVDIHKIKLEDCPDLPGPHMFNIYPILEGA